MRREVVLEPHVHARSQTHRHQPTCEHIHMHTQEVRDSSKVINLYRNKNNNGKYIHHNKLSIQGRVTEALWVHVFISNTGSEQEELWAHDICLMSADCVENGKDT